MDEARPELNAGDKIGKYVILRQLGRGNVATVYLAEQQFTRRKVAVNLCDVQNPHHYQQMFGKLDIQA